MGTIDLHEKNTKQNKNFRVYVGPQGGLFIQKGKQPRQLKETEFDIKWEQNTHNLLPRGT